MTVTDLAAAPASQEDLSTAETDEGSLHRWPGYAPLSAADAERLLGRDDEIAGIVRMIERPKTGQAAVVWLHGPSGCGKTSLIQAGICPALSDGLGEGFRAIRVVPELGDDASAVIDAIAGAILKESPEEDDMSLDFDHRTRQFSLLHSQDPAEATEYLASCFKRSRPAGVDDPEKSKCLVVLDDFDAFAPDEASIFPGDETWQQEHLRPVIRFILDIIMTGAFPCVIALRSPNMEATKSALAMCDIPNLGTWYPIEMPDLKTIRPFFQSAPAELHDSDHVNVEPMLLDSLIEDAGGTGMGIPFISETLRKLSDLDPGAEDLSTADAGWAGGGIWAKFALAAESAVPTNLDDDSLGELMLSLQKKIRSGERKGESIPSKAQYLDVTTRSRANRVLVDNLIDARVLTLSGTSLDTAEVEWSVPEAPHKWERAKRWLKEEDGRLDTAQRFETKREEWEKEERSPVLLVHASRALSDARTLLAHHEKRPFLSEEVFEYLEASLEMDVRLSGEIRSEKVGGNLIKWGGIALGVVLLIFLIWFFFLR